MNLLLIIPRLGAKMRAVTNATSLWRMVAAFGLLCGGCATGPRYEHAEQADSASIEGPVMPVQGAENGSCTVVIMQIDGLAANFTASHLGLNWLLFDAKRPINVDPGKHALVLSISDVDEVYGNVGHGNVGEVGVYTAGSKPAVTANFLANHMYRITANLEGGAIEVTLWDETGGVATRSRVATWTVDSNGGYSENALPSGGRK